MKRKLNCISSIAIVVLVFFLLPTATYGQIQSLQFEPAKSVSASMETTVNERGNSVLCIPTAGNLWALP